MEHLNSCKCNTAFKYSGTPLSIQNADVILLEKTGINYTSVSIGRRIINNERMNRTGLSGRINGLKLQSTIKVEILECGSWPQ